MKRLTAALLVVAFTMPVPTTSLGIVGHLLAGGRELKCIGCGQRASPFHDYGYAARYSEDYDSYFQHRVPGPHYRPVPRLVRPWATSTLKHGLSARNDCAAASARDRQTVVLARWPHVTTAP